MDLNLQGKTAFVGGASRGIGAATARQLASQGARVILAARNGQALQAVCDECAGSGHRPLVCDYDDTAQTIELIESTLKSPVHILINNAGGPPGGPLIDAEPADFVAAFQRHLIMNQALLRAFHAGMVESGYGRVINVISTSVYEPIPGLGVSNTTRGAVASWAKTMATELGPDAITVNNVLPGFTDTERLHSIIANRSKASGKSQEEVANGMRAEVPLRRFADAAETAALIGFLASPAAAYISGQSIAVDGGRTRSI